MDDMGISTALLSNWVNVNIQLCVFTLGSRKKSSLSYCYL